MWNNCKCYTLEPGWEGHVTLEFSNTTPLPAKIYANRRVAQFILLKETKNQVSHMLIEKEIYEAKGCNASKNLNLFNAKIDHQRQKTTQRKNFSIRI